MDTNKQYNVLQRSLIATNLLMYLESNNVLEKKFS